jgi:16S rRNA processing protein RimM
MANPKQTPTPYSPALAAFATQDWPSDAIEVGRVIGAYGLRGQIKVAPLAAVPEALLRASTWWLEHGLPVSKRYAVATRGRKLQAGAVAASIDGVDDRTKAEAFKGATVFVSRAEFPAAKEGEFYWIDLIGLSVVNKQGVTLGKVVGLLDAGAQGVLRVAYSAIDEAGVAVEAERLIPFVDAYVGTVSLEKKLIEVDWGEDY